VFARTVAPPLSTRSTQFRQFRSTVLYYAPGDPRRNVDGPDAAPFLARVDANHDLRVTRGELGRFIGVSIDLNHDGKISIYEATLLQVRDPQAARFLFPGPANQSTSGDRFSAASSMKPWTRATSASGSASAPSSARALL
jgi:hypothetical protein